MSNTARPKLSSTAPAFFSESDPENPRKDFNDPSARPSGRSGGPPAVSTPHRVSTSRRGTKKQRSRRRG